MRYVVMYHYVYKQCRTSEPLFILRSRFIFNKKKETLKRKCICRVFRLFTEAWQSLTLRRPQDIPLSCSACFHDM